MVVESECVQNVAPAEPLPRVVDAVLRAVCESARKLRTVDTARGLKTQASMAIRNSYQLLALVVLASSACNSPTQPDSQLGQVGQALEVTTVDLSRYVRVGRYNLPEPSRTTPPDGINLLAKEASSVTYNWDSDTLFVVSDSGTSVVQVSKTGALIDTMTLAAGSSPQGTEFYDTEGITYVGNGQFVFVEERVRQAVQFTYAPGTTLNRVDTQTVKLGTTIGNIGLEGLTFDPPSGNFIVLKEKDPRSIFETSIDFPAGIASNGSPTTSDSVNLFDPALVNTLDFSDIFALSNLPALGSDSTYDELLILSQESGRIVQVDRTGAVQHTLTIVADPSDALAVPDMTVEGVTMDRDGNLYVVSENGGGDASYPQLWVYAPSTASNNPPSAVALSEAVTSLPEETSTASAVNLAQILVTDDGLGDNTLLISGPDAGFFEVVGTALFLKAGTTLNATTKPSYEITVAVDDATVGTSPDAATPYTLTITEASSGSAVLAITEVAPWSSGNSPLGCDWFEVTNVGTASVSLVGWTMDDNSNSSALAVALNGISSISPGESVLFLETNSPAAKADAMRNLWFGASPPNGLQIGSYTGAGVGLSTGGDSVNLFDSNGVVRATVSFGASPGSAPFASFDNAAAINNGAITSLSVVGQYGAFVAVNSSTEVGSPGTIGTGATPIVGVSATDSNASEAGSAPGVFRFTRSGNTASPLTVLYSIASGIGQAVAGDYAPLLSGSEVIPSGAAFVDVSITPVDDAVVEGDETVTLTLIDTGSYDVGANASATVTIADDDAPPPPVGNLVITEVAPWSSGNSPLGSDWFEVTNIGTASITVTGWKMDDNSNSNASAVALHGITSIGAGESVLFIEVTPANLATEAQQMRDVWFGSSVPSGLQIGGYSGSGVGLGTGGDAVNLFDDTGSLRANVTFGASPGSAPFTTFDNSVGANNVAITTFSAVGQNGAFVAVNSANEVGSPGAIAAPPPVLVGITAPDSDASEAGSSSGVFRFSRSGSTTDELTVQYTIAMGAGQATASEYSPTLTGSQVIAAGAAFVEVTITPVDDSAVEGVETLTVTLADTSSYDLGLTPTATIAIVDNDSLPPPSSALVITEVAPWSSSSSFGRDWFEVTNVGSTPVTLTGWRVDDSSHAFSSAILLSGVASLAPGEAVIFIETATGDEGAAATAFRNLWFGGKSQPAPQIGTYTGSGIGLSTSGDEVVLFDALGNLMTGVGFGTAPSSVPLASFDNFASDTSNTLPLPVVSTLSSVGVNRAFAAVSDAGQIGSPGIGNVGRLIVTEVAPWGSGSGPYGADWFEVTNIGGSAVDMTGWTVDDSSNSFASSVALTGVPSVAAGQSAIFYEGDSSTASAFVSAWFGTTPPDGFLLGSYSGSGVGLSTSGDAVNLFDAAGNHMSGVQFGASTDLYTFDNAAGRTTVTTLSVVGVDGAFLAPDGIETGSPGAIENPPAPPAPVPALPAGLSVIVGALMAGFGGSLARARPRVNRL